MQIREWTGSPSQREAARIIAAALRQDAAAQDAGHFDTIGERYDAVYGEVLSVCADYPSEIATGFEFWDWWVDARNHEWHHYGGIGREDWSRLARHVADSIEAGQGVTDPTLVQHFERAIEHATQPGPVLRIKRFLGW